MAFVTVMLTTQPTYITGIHDYDAARSSAFGAMMAFGATFGLSVVILVRNGKKMNSAGAGSNVVGGGGEVDYDDRLNIDLRRNYGEKKVYGSVATDSY